MNTTIDVTFPEGSRVDAQVGPHLIHTDQSTDSGGAGSAPEPGALFLASIASCSGWYALKFCQARDIPTKGLGLSMEVSMDEKTKMIGRILLRLALPGEFPRKIPGRRGPGHEPVLCEKTTFREHRLRYHRGVT